jgi:peptidoglycan biosynthesis protein MviN/MurJ (putative lipid II flippase)
VNIVLMLALVEPYGVEGLALALSVSATIEVVGLLVALRRRLGRLDGRLLAASLARSSAATLVAGAVMLATLVGLGAVAPDLGSSAIGRLLTLLVPAALGGVAYLVVALVLGAPELDVLRRLAGRGRAAVTRS